MKFFRLLPCKPEEVDTWLFDYLLVVHGTLASIVEDDELEDINLRKRNEKLSSYLGTLNNVISAYQQKMDYKRRQYIRQHPKPEKGVTEWRDTLDSELVDERRVCENVEGVIRAIETRLSITQSNLKSKGKER